MARSTRDIVVWEEVVEVLDKKIELAIAMAAAATDLRAMGVAQGLLQAYRDVKGLPHALVSAAEMDEADRKNREAIQASQLPGNWQHPHLIAR